MNAEDREVLMDLLGFCHGRILRDTILLNRWQANPNVTASSKHKTQKDKERWQLRRDALVRVIHCCDKRLDSPAPSA